MKLIGYRGPKFCLLKLHLIVSHIYLFNYLFI